MVETAENKAPALEWIDDDMPFSPEFGDHFYCREDGRAECGHVFLAGNGLPERWKAGGAFVIGELGFGTGLNFCETWRAFSASLRGEKTPPQPLPTRGRGLDVALCPSQTAAEYAERTEGERRLKDVKEETDATAKPLPLVGRGWGGESRALHFISFELHPMDRADIGKALSRWPEIEAERQALVAAWPDDPRGVVRLQLAEDVTLTVVCGDAFTNLSESTETFDAWYLDGFAPSRNPAMWSGEILNVVHDHTRPGGTFATYAAAGFVRRNLIAAGFAVERRPGFAGKREMLCGRRS